jgi:hypothetical protein
LARQRLPLFLTQNLFEVFYLGMLSKVMIFELFLLGSIKIFCGANYFHALPHMKMPLAMNILRIERIPLLSKKVWLNFKFQVA